MNTQRLNNAYQCQVCQGRYDQLYNISDCGHRFCMECCINYIEAKSLSFEAIRCMAEGCNKPFSLQTEVYNKLGQRIKYQIKKHNRLVFLYNNPHLKNCAYPQCEGIINIKQNYKKLLCNGGQHQHCPKCLKLIHQKQCDNEDDLALQALNYRKCPKCSIWVQKIKGCEYISCKCGIMFCYQCGAQFSKDPCRKKQLWKKQQYTRRLLKEIHLPRPNNFLCNYLLYAEYVLFIPKLVFKIIVSIFWTMILTLLPLLLMLGVVLPLIFIFSPLLLLIPISSINENQRKCCCSSRCFYRLALFLFYPILGALFTLLVLIILLLYPFCRNTNHHGIYDPIDLKVVDFANFYLQMIVCLFKI